MRVTLYIALTTYCLITYKCDDIGDINCFSYTFNDTYHIQWIDHQLGHLPKSIKTYISIKCVYRFSKRINITLCSNKLSSGIQVNLDSRQVEDMLKNIGTALEGSSEPENLEANILELHYCYSDPIQWNCGNFCDMYTLLQSIVSYFSNKNITFPTVYVKSVYDNSPMSLAPLTKAKKLVVTQSNLKQGILNNTINLQYLDIVDTEMYELPLGIFQNLHNLLELNLSRNQLKYWKRECYGNALKSLLKLTLSGNKMKRIDVDSFHGMTILRNLTLDRNEIEQIDDGAFNSLYKLSELDLSRNRLNYWKREYFGNASGSLLKLALSDNKIKRIDGDSLHDMVNLTNLTLNSNEIEELDDGTFKNLRNLLELNVSGNKLKYWKQEYFGNASGTLLKLTLSENKITRIDADSFHGMLNLTYLTLYSNQIKELDDGIFKNLYNLFELNLSGNRLKYWKREYYGNALGSLLKLALSMNQIMKIDVDSFHGMVNLINLTLEWNKIGKLDDGSFKSLRNLLELNLSGNNIKYWQQAYYGNALGSLLNLELSYNYITRIDADSFHSMLNLRNLNLGWNPIGELDDGIFQNLRNLLELNLSGNQLKYWTQEYYGNALGTLLKLTLTKNEITRIDVDSFHGMLNLTHLSLDSNEIEELDDGSFESLRNLLELNLSQNKLKYWKGSYYGNALRNLTTLILNKNKIKRLGADSFHGMVTLKTLILGRNEIKEMDNGTFNNSHNLEDLDLSHNNLKIWNLEHHAGVLTKLTKLDLSENKIDTLSPPGNFSNKTKDWETTFNGSNPITVQTDAFSGMRNLIMLNLCGNCIERLPDGIFLNLDRLKSLNLAHNKLKVWSSYSMQSLETLNLEENEIQAVANDAFMKMYELKILNLGKNKLTAWTITNHSKSLNELYLNNNSLDCSIEFLNSFTGLIVDLSYNQLHDSVITIVPYEAPHGRQYINLKGNMFENTIFVKYESGRWVYLNVNLKHNKLSFIDLGALELFQKPRYIFMYGYQRLQRLPTITYEIDENPLLRDCFSCDMVEYMKNRNLIFTAKNLNCPTFFDKFSFGDLKDLSCNIKNAHDSQVCLANCSCSFMGANKTSMIIDCSHSNLYRTPNMTITFPFKYIIYNIATCTMNLSNNKISDLSTNDNYESVTELDLSNNLLTTIHWLPPKIKVLLLNSNHISIFNLTSIHILENCLSLQRVEMHNNPWSCDSCSLSNFTKALRKVPLNLIVPNPLNCKNGHNLFDLKETDLCKEPEDSTLIALTILLVIFLLFTSISLILFHIYEKQLKIWLYSNNMLLCCITEEELDQDKEFDAFVSYAHQDQDFIARHLAPGLENGEPRFKLCIHVRDWIVGEFISRQIIESVEKSRRTIIVLSKNFLQSAWAIMEFRTAHTQAMNDKRNRLIIILYDDIQVSDIGDEELKVYITTNTYIKWGDPWFWQRLKYAMPHSHRQNVRNRRNQEVDEGDGIEMRAFNI